MWDKIWAFINDESNRSLLAWAGGGVVALFVGGWKVFTYFDLRKSSTPPASSPSAVQTSDSSGTGPGGNATPGYGALVIPPELLKALSQGQTEGKDKLIDLAKQLGVHENAVAGMLRILGEKQVPPELLPQKLAEIATRFKETLEQLQSLKSDDPKVQRLRQEALQALEEGEYDHADNLLQQAQEADEQAIAAQEAALDKRRFSAAQTLATRGNLEQSRLNYYAAAEHFSQAAVRVPEKAQDHRWRYLMDQSKALYSQGNEFGDNRALYQALEVCHNALSLRSRNEFPLDWATIQNNLGIILQTIGERESDTQRLEEALVAFRAALEERTRDRVPMDWAVTQNNLGNVLSQIGVRETVTKRLEEAVAAYRAVLEVCTQDKVPFLWAATQTNLGSTLQTIGGQEAGTERLEEAIIAYRAALEVWTRDRVPMNWATIQNNLGTTLLKIGEREEGTGRFEEAVVAHRCALEEHTRDRVPLQWADAQNNLGNALRRIGEREVGTKRMEEAVVAYRLALEERTRDRVPLLWAMTQSNLGNALLRIGERDPGTEYLEGAVAAYRSSLEERTRDRVPMHWADSNFSLALTLAILAERTHAPDPLDEAADRAQGALEVYHESGITLKQKNTEKLLAWIKDLQSKIR